MKKLAILMLLIFPFSAFASTLEEVQNIELNVKTKTYNWLVLYKAVEKALDKKTKWDDKKKLTYYKKLISQTEKRNDNLYKKLTIILKYWKNNLENELNNNINSVSNKTNSAKIEDVINANKNSWYSDWKAYYWNEWVVSWHWNFSDEEIMAAWRRAYNNKSEYEKQRSWIHLTIFVSDYNESSIINKLQYEKDYINEIIAEWEEYNLVHQDLKDNYNNYLSIFKDWWAIKQDEIKEKFIRVLTSKYKDWITEDEFIESLWYRYENWNLIYKDSLNTFKEKIKDFDYLK